MKKAGKMPQDLDAVAVTEGPGLAGALLVGNSVAYGIGLALDIPVVGIHHLEGHLLSSLLAEDKRRFHSSLCLCRADIPKLWKCVL